MSYDSEIALGAAESAAASASSAATSADFASDLIVAPNDETVAALVADDGSDTYEALAASAAVAGQVTDALSFNGFQDFVQKVRTQQQDVNLLLVGDSTTDLVNVGQSYAYGLPAAIGTRFTTHTVKQRVWNTTSHTWGAASTVQTGADYRADLGAPKIITVWSGGWASMNWRDFFDAAWRSTFWLTPTPDAIVVALGHNDSYSIAMPAIRGRNVALLEWVRTMLPAAHIILSSQNPRPGAGGSLTPGQSELRNDLYRELARERGYGYINVTQAFYDDGRSLAAGGPLLEAAGVHPSTAGATLWRDVVLAQIDAAPGAPVLPATQSSLSVLGRSLASAQTRPIASNGWTLTNITEASEATIKQRTANSVKLTKTAGGSAAYAVKAMTIAEVKGRNVCAFAWFYVPTAGAGTGPAVIWIRADGALVGFTVDETTVRDQWFPISTSGLIPAAAAAADIVVWVDQGSGGTGPLIYVDTCDAFIGDLPLDVA